LITCSDEPAIDAGPLPDGLSLPDAPLGLPDAALPDVISLPDAATVDAVPSDGGQSFEGLDEPCCDPTGTCDNGMVCLENQSDDTTRCRPRCTVGSSGECPEPSRCLMFDDGMGVCMPASQAGEECAPEFCAEGLVCVGPNEPSAFCRRCCTGASDCSEGEACATLMGNSACSMACIPQ
jgi:hypothetical protein